MVERVKSGRSCGMKVTKVDSGVYEKFNEPSKTMGRTVYPWFQIIFKVSFSDRILDNLLKAIEKNNSRLTGNIMKVNEVSFIPKYGG